jgi:hypothetical protein
LPSDFCAGGSGNPQPIAENPAEIKGYVTAPEAAAHSQQYWLYVEMPHGTERGYLDKPSDRPTLHVWVDHKKYGYTEYVATYDERVIEHGEVEYFSVTPYGKGWKRTKRKPYFMQLRDHRPSTVWCRKVVRS